MLPFKSLKWHIVHLAPDLAPQVKSYIVSIGKVDTLEGNMVHIGKEKLPIGASYRDEVLKRVFQ